MVSSAVHRFGNGILHKLTRSIWKMLGPFATASHRTPPVLHCHSPGVATVASMPTTTMTTTTTRDRGDRYGPMEWAQLLAKFLRPKMSRLALWTGSIDAKIPLSSSIHGHCKYSMWHWMHCSFIDSTSQPPCHYKFGESAFRGLRNYNKWRRWMWTADPACKAVGLVSAWVVIRLAMNHNQSIINKLGQYIELAIYGQHKTDS